MSTLPSSDREEDDMILGPFSLVFVRVDHLSLPHLYFSVCCPNTCVYILLASPLSLPSPFFPLPYV
ncbi:hypothetical protein EDB89DRAFT_2065162 [Lactarius sanguifluus]|nr:hypothetical protein EDB89DRAFT_2065162 [Lactarius sanguifluus]